MAEFLSRERGPAQLPLSVGGAGSSRVSLFHANARWRRVSTLSFSPRQRSEQHLTQALLEVAEQIEQLVREETATEDAAGMSSMVGAGAAWRWRSPEQKVFELQLLSRATLLQLQLLRARLLATLRHLEESIDFWCSWLELSDRQLYLRGASYLSLIHI